MKTYTSIQVYCQGDRILSNPLENETEKALMIMSPNGQWVGKTSDALWIPKSICTVISEKSNQVDSDCIEVIRKIDVPVWFADKNRLR